MTTEGERGPGAAPELELPDTDGRLRALPAPGESAATVVIWTCNHCPYAIAWQDRLAAVARDYAGRGVSFLAVNSNDAERFSADSPAAMRERVEREDWPFPYLWDESQEAARAWGARVTPHLFVLDPELRLRWQGAPDADYEDPGQGAAWLREALEAVLGGQEPPPDREPVGCSIKWRP